ncbi:16771_t:CDS:2 [Funneliformis geosporum]|uniref:16771_t:CDS:1 n=1 Tax=Funneliformis geosporum TaxID=1117311 RepID=A0A9W4SRT5_9GLOM|nr:16771_t:CDS:2 [Funneliformis geosporum]
MNWELLEAKNIECNIAAVELLEAKNIECNIAAVVSFFVLGEEYWM